MTNTYEDIVSGYNLIKDDENLGRGTDEVPHLPSNGTDGSGNHYITYTIFQSATDVENSDQYSSSDGEVLDFYNSYNNDLEDAVENILTDSGGWSSSFENVAKINFTTPQDISSTDTGIITFGQQSGNYNLFDDVGEASRTAVTQTYVPQSNSTDDQQSARVHGDIWFHMEHEASGDGLEDQDDNVWTDFGDIDEGTWAYKVIYEEISHALGIDFLNIDDPSTTAINEAVNNQFATQKYSVTAYAPYGHVMGSDLLPDVDTDSSTVVLYGEDNDNDGNQDVLQAYGLQLYDIAALQALYGANKSTRSGDDTYKLGQGLGRDGTNDGSVNASDKDKAFIYTIWDGGGTDTLDASDFNTFGAKIDLRPGHFSSIGTDGKGIALWDESAGIEGQNVAIAYDDGTEDHMIENAVGTSKGDYIIGNSLANEITGGAGDDTLEGGAGTDTYIYNSGDGEDTIDDDWSETNKLEFGTGITSSSLSYVRSGDDLRIELDNSNHITLTDFNLTNSNELEILFDGGAVEDVLYSNASSVYGTDDDDTILGGAGSNYIYSELGDDRVFGGAGNDRIYIKRGAGDHNEVYGEDGNDRIEITSSPGVATTAYLNGGVGDDYYRYTVNTISSAEIEDSSGDDNYYVSGGATITDTGAGDDRLSTTAGTSPTLTISDDGGFDIWDIGVFVTGDIEDISFSSSTSGNDLSVTMTRFSASSTFIFEDYYLGSQYRYEEVHFYGGEEITFDYVVNNGDYVVGTSGNDSNISGSSDDDLIFGFGGDDTLSGGGGDDDLDGGDGVDTVSYASAAAGVNVHLNNGVASDDGDGGADSISNVETVIGSAYADTIFGSGGDDTIYGGDGNDTIESLTGDDIIYGEAGDDIITGGSDDDIIYGGDGNDNINSDAGNDVVYGEAGNDELRGSSGQDLMYGGTGADKIYGNEDDDTLHGGDGNDRLYGRDDNDTLYGDAGVDRLYGDGGDDIMHGGADNDYLYGHTGDDTLYGDAGNDAIYGLDNDDVLYGGDGNDTLVGGAGADEFVVLATDTGTDTITDFSTSEGDALNLSDVIAFDPLTDTITDFVQITDNGTDSTVAVDADGTANGASFVTIATLQGVTGLTDESALVTSGNLIAA